MTRIARIRLRHEDQAGRVSQVLGACPRNTRKDTKVLGGINSFSFVSFVCFVGSILLYKPSVPSVEFVVQLRLRRSRTG